MAGNKLKLIIVDDSEDEALLLRRSLKKVECCEVIGILPDGEIARDYLSGKGAYENRQQFPVPDVMVLDIKMPRLSGLDVLAWMSQQTFRKPAVIMLSSALTEETVAQCINSGALQCLEKAEPGENAQSIAGFLQGISAGEGSAPSAQT